LVAAEISALVFSDVINMYTGSVSKTIAKRIRKKYDQRNAQTRSRLMLLRLRWCLGLGSLVIGETATAVIASFLRRLMSRGMRPAY
jgi:hypothetical protein